MPWAACGAASNAGWVAHLIRVDDDERGVVIDEVTRQQRGAGSAFREHVSIGDFAARHEPLQLRRDAVPAAVFCLRRCFVVKPLAGQPARVKHCGAPRLTDNMAAPLFAGQPGLFCDIRAHK